MLRLSALCCLTALLAFGSDAQTYNFDTERSSIQIEGTSNNTPHWVVYATEFSGSVTLNADELSAVEAATLTVPAKMIKSRKSGIMDRVMYDALDVRSYPEVTYELVSVSDFEQTSDTTATMVSHGNLTLYGTTNEVTVPLEATLDGASSTLVFRCSHTIALSDYGMKPPTAMFGSLRTGNEVTVIVELHAGPIE